MLSRGFAAAKAAVPARMSSTTLDALVALQPLESLPRTGWIQRGVAAPESVGDHVLGACFIVLALGPRVDPPLDVERALALVLVHDAPEALLGDLPRTASELLPPGAKAQAEERAAARVLTPLSELAHARFVEYRAGVTREARFARVCDRLHLGVRMVGYVRSGARGLDDFASTVAALDCSEFAPALALQREILAALSRAA
jgi:putative hydrolase of HD superfamily